MQSLLKIPKSVERQRGIILCSIGIDNKVFTLCIEKTSRLKAMSSYRGRWNISGQSLKALSSEMDPAEIRLIR